MILGCSDSHSSLLNLFPCRMALVKCGILSGLLSKFGSNYLIVCGLNFSWEIHRCSSCIALALQGLSSILLYLEVATTLASKHGWPWVKHLLPLFVLVLKCCSNEIWISFAIRSVQVAWLCHTLWRKQSSFQASRLILTLRQHQVADEAAFAWEIERLQRLWPLILLMLLFLLHTCCSCFCLIDTSVLVWVKWPLLL